MNLAAASGDTKLLRSLIQQSEVGIYFSDCRGRTPLHEAAGAGRIDCVKDILSTFGGGQGELHPDEEEWHPLSVELELGVGEATASNSTNSEYVNWNTKDGCTALLLAVRKRHHEVVKLLLKAGGNINLKDKTGLSPLHMGVRVDNLDMVKLLIEKGADVNATDAKSRSSLHYAAEKGFRGLVEILAPLCCLNRCDAKEKTALYLAAENGHDHCVEVLAEAGACVNTRAADFTTPLMAATTNQCDKCVEVLLNYKANPNLRCSRVWPKLPIHAAVKGLNKNILKMLIAVTDRAVDSSDGMVSPLYAAVDNPPMLELLLSEGFSPDGQDCRNMYGLDSPLSLVLSQGDMIGLESIRRPFHSLMAAGARMTKDSWHVCLTEPSLLSPLIHYKRAEQEDKDKTKGLFGSSELQALQKVAAENSAALDPTVLLLPNLRPVHILMAAGARMTRDSWHVCLKETSLVSLFQYRMDRKQQDNTKGLFDSRELEALQNVAAANSESAAQWLPNLLTAGLDPSVLLLPNLFKRIDPKMLNYLLAFVNWTTLSPELKDILQGRQICYEGFPSLFHLCRLKIRDTVGSDVLMGTNAVEHLPLPTVLHNNITFSDILPP